MGTAERRERERQQRRDSIITAAEKIFFSAENLSLVKMDDIAQEAELSKGTLYLYFKTKEELMMTVHMRALQMLQESFGDDVAKAETGLDIIKIIGRTYIKFAFENPEIFRFMSHKKLFHSQFPDEEGEAYADCHKMGFRIFDLITEAINRGMSDGTIKKGLNPQIVAVNLYGQLSGVLDTSFYEDKHILAYIGENAEVLVENCFELILSSIQA